jgi:rhodanese-related sulfurtransferase
MSSFFSTLRKVLAPPVAGASIDVGALKALLDGDGAVVVDVRSPAEFAGGHVPGAVNVPLDRVVGAPELASFAGQTVHLICQSGGRSGRAAALLANGNSPVVNVLGGTGGWRAAGFPIER